MPKDWFPIINDLTPSIVKIETPSGNGTGFFWGYNQTKTWTLIATAHHVVEGPDKWLQPIRIQHAKTNKTVLVQEADRVIIPDEAKDSAVIFISTPEIKGLGFPDEPIVLIEKDMVLRVGVEVAWLGYPSIAPDTLCFFSGKISARQSRFSSYLIDGVAINGVSGGPVFSRTGAGDKVELIGIISAYLPNRRAAGTLPGLCVAQDVSHLQIIVSKLKNKAEAEQAKKEQEAALPPPTSAAE